MFKRRLQACDRCKLVSCYTCCAVVVYTSNIELRSGKQEHKFFYDSLKRDRHWVLQVRKMLWGVHVKKWSTRDWRVGGKVCGRSRILLQVAVIASCDYTGCLTKSGMLDISLLWYSKILLYFCIVYIIHLYKCLFGYCACIFMFNANSAERIFNTRWNVRFRRISYYYKMINHKWLHWSEMNTGCPKKSGMLDFCYCYIEYRKFSIFWFHQVKHCLLKRMIPRSFDLVW